MDTVNQLQNHLISAVFQLDNGLSFKDSTPRLVLKDGTTVSVQASRYHYCTPRDDSGPYTHVECGFPSKVPSDEMLKYAEITDIPTKTVYPYVPIEIVAEWINECGGIADNQLVSVQRANWEIDN